MAGIGVPSTRGLNPMQKGVMPGIPKTTTVGSAATAGMPQLHGQAIQSRKNLNSLKVASQKAGARPGTIAPQYQAQAQRQAAISGGSFATSPQMQALGGGGMPQAGAGASEVPGTSYNPQEMNISAQNNPQLQALTDEMGQYRSQLAGGADQDAIFALQRQRDLTSGLAKEYGANAASRGIFGSGAEQDAILNRIVEPGQAQMAELNARLAGDARAKQLGALGQQAQITQDNAQLTQADKNFALQSWTARDQAQRAQAELALRQQQIQSNQGMQLASLLSGIFTGL